MSSKSFAVGRDEIGGCECPARVAGYAPGDGDDTTHIAERWDDIVRDLPSVNERHLVVAEEVAKDAWLRMVDEFKERRLKDDYELAQHIAEKNGWL